MQPQLAEEKQRFLKFLQKEESLRDREQDFSAHMETVHKQLGEDLVGIDQQFQVIEKTIDVLRKANKSKIEESALLQK